VVAVTRVRRILAAARIEAFRACRRRGHFDVNDVLDYIVGAFALDTLEQGGGEDVRGDRARAGDQNVVGLLTTLDLARRGIAVAGTTHGARNLELAARARARERLKAIL
jgi:hypothetical protein